MGEVLGGWVVEVEVEEGLGEARIQCRAALEVILVNWGWVV